MHVMIIACYHPLPLPTCMLHFDLVSMLFGTSIPTSFNILVKMFYTCFTVTRINLLTFMQSSTSLAYCISISRIASNCRVVMRSVWSTVERRFESCSAGSRFFGDESRVGCGCGAGSFLRPSLFNPISLHL